MLGEECGGALVGLFGGSGVPMGAADVREGVVAPGINMEADGAIPTQRSPNLLLCLLRDELVLGRDMQEERFGNGARLVQGVLDADAVIADVGIRVRAGGHEVRQL